ncbi:MAG TPA: GNAT family N-acetyltransferase, partial [Actinomycetes bacterium]
ERVRERGLRVVALSAQTHALGFYERLGYRAHGDVFDDAGLPHRWMTKAVPPAG